jgi:hypothetical protein
MRGVSKRHNGGGCAAAVLADGGAARSLRGRSSGVKGRYAIARDGLRPPLTPEPLRPLCQDPAGRRCLPAAIRALHHPAAGCPGSATPSPKQDPPISSLYGFRGVGVSISVP